MSRTPTPDDLDQLVASARAANPTAVTAERARELAARAVASAEARRAERRTSVLAAVLVAAAFCMFNRYVDGLAAVTPEGREAYDAMGVRLATEGYTRPAR